MSYLIRRPETEEPRDSRQETVATQQVTEKDGPPGKPDTGTSDGYQRRPYFI